MIGRIQRAIAISQLSSKRIRIRRFWAQKLVLAAPGIQEYHRGQVKRQTRKGEAPPASAIRQRGLVW